MVGLEPWLQCYPHTGPTVHVAQTTTRKPTIAVVAPSIALFLWFWVAYQTSPLRKQPGPFLAGFTNLWRLWQVVSADYAHRMKKLHELDHWWQDYIPHMFSETDNVEHPRLKRPVVRHYSVPSILAMEPHMNNVISGFLGHLQKRYVELNKVCEFGEWLGYYGWDFLGIVTLSKKFGYMKEGKDIDGTLVMPWLDYWLDKTRAKTKTSTPKCPIFLQYFIESKSTHPDIVDEGKIIGYLMLDLIADVDADTTAITMRALPKLQFEIRCQFPHFTPVPHAKVRSLPYLDSVIRETLRYHPAVSIIMERIVPAGGLTLPGGSFIPAGMNPYIVAAKGGGDGLEYGERMKVWNTAHLTFGGGSRICLWGNLSPRGG
ncbi:cytochrome P450 [Immersiella caudata]|uniref:Cytochrome P450 n=1 Tax=Immersiella caudata TaxID=314043 RepID=A0AA39WC74_9PEZI|nr:cytochrome P450 [Immersiella caudata]